MPNGFRHRIHLVILTAYGLAFLAGAAHGQDTVILSSPGNRQARSRITGDVVEYTGKQIVVKLSEDREIKRPGQLVVSIETNWPAAKNEGDRLFEQHQFSQAREKYSTAIRSETRPWARRAILARIIACYQELNQFEAAGKLFLAVVREDPETPYFDAIPLAWQSTDLPASLAQTASQWLAEENPVAGLIGASQLVSSLKRQEALERLSQLALAKDARVASLAAGQAWRVSIPTAKADQLTAWERRVEDFPEALRAGPYWVLGRALAQHGQADRALLAFLHVPLIYPQARPLAADALRAAAALLEQQGDKAGALRLRQELVSVYPESPAALEVKSTLDESLPAAAATSVSLEAGGVEATFLAGLRARRLFALAEERCRQRLGDTGLSETTRLDLAVELSRTLNEHALHEGQAEREQLWRAAIKAVRQPGLESIEGSRRLLLDAQEGLVHLTRGELARQEAELAGSNDASLEAARQELRAAIGLLQATLKEVGRELRQASQSRRVETGDLNANELAWLERNLQFELARAFRNQGESYPPKSDDRTNSLRQAAEQLQPLATADADAVAWQARLDEIVCLRLLEDFEAAAAKIGKLNDSELPAAVLPSVKAEQIRLLLDQHQLDAALAAMEKMQASGTEVTAELSYAILEVDLAAWRAAETGNRPNDAAQWQNRAAALVAQIDARFGRYWSRRAEMLLASSVTRGGATQNLAVLVRAAESFYRSGQFEQSLEAYDRAARQAREEKQELAFDYAYTAAAIEQRRGRHADAAKRFRAAALGNVANAKAADAHLLAIYNLALAAKEGGEKEGPPVNSRGSTQAYLDLLREHLDRWPRSPTAGQARIWLGGFYERQKKWPEAIEAYKAVRVGDQQETPAIEGIGRCFQSWLAEVAARQESTRDVAAKAAAYFEHVVTGSRGKLPERWSQTQRLAATSAAAIWLEYGDGDAARAERFLSAALADSSNTPEAWKSTAQTLQIFALAAQGRREEAAQLLSRLSGDAPDEMLALIDGLQKSAEKAPAKVKHELAELQLQAAKRLQGRVADLPADEQRKFQRAYVTALAAAEKRDEAVAAAKRLADAFPRDGELQEEYARLLVDSDDRKSLETAAARWRDIAQKTRQGSDRWLRSMYYQALAARRLGNRDQASRFVKFTEGLVPELGGAEMKAKFHELLEDRPAKKGRSP